MSPRAGKSGHEVVRWGLGGLGGQEALVGLEVPSLQGCLPFQPGQGSQVDPVDLEGLSFLLGPGYRHLPWGRWGRAAPEYPLGRLEGAVGPSQSLWLLVAPGGLHLQGCPGRPGSPRVGQGLQG